MNIIASLFVLIISTQATFIDIERIKQNFEYIFSIENHPRQADPLQIPVLFTKGFTDGIMEFAELPNITICYQAAQNIATNILSLVKNVGSHTDVSVLISTSYQSYTFYSECIQGTIGIASMLTGNSIGVLSLAKDLLYNWNDIKTNCEKIFNNEANAYDIGMYVSKILAKLYCS